MILVCVNILLLVICIRMYRQKARPYNQVSKLLKKFNETRDIQELQKEDLSAWPEFLNTANYIVEEEKFGTLTELRKKHAEYLALQNQINPHFLFNTLEAIRGDALGAGMVNLAATTNALATYFRYTITEVGNIVRLEDELENIENYYTIQKYRFEDRISMEIDYPDEHLGYLSVRLPKLTLQPIVENTISHGLEGKVGKGLIRIEIESTKENLFIHVKDNGIGMDEQTVKELNSGFQGMSRKLINETDEVGEPQMNAYKPHTGIALSNIDNRIKLLFGEEYGLHVYSIVGVGTDVQVILPLIYDDIREKKRSEPNS